MTDRKPAPIGINDVGGLFTTDGRDCWELLSVSPGPVLLMAPMVPTDNGKKGSPADFEKFLRLVPEVAPKRPYHKKQQPQEQTDG